MRPTSWIARYTKYARFLESDGMLRNGSGLICVLGGGRFGRRLHGHQIEVTHGRYHLVVSAMSWCRMNCDCHTDHMTNSGGL